MSFKEHELLLGDVVEEFRKKGWKVIRLSGIKGHHPDAVAINGENIKTIGIEVTTGKSPHNLYSRKLQYKKYGFETDDVIIIANGFKVDRRIPPEAYYLALKLREFGAKYREIERILKQKFNPAPSQSTIVAWCNRGMKPPFVKAKE